MDSSLEVSATEEDEMHSCIFCPYSTKDKSNFNKHVRNQHSDKQPLGTSTPRKSTKKHICDQCAREYQSKFGLDLHMKSKHNGQFKHVCAMCGKGYNQSVQYRFHVASHGSVGLEKCKTCTAEFTSAGSLRRHMASCHNNNSVNLYTCKVCSRGFPQKYKLTEHVRGKHGEPRYQCQQCGNRFNWRSSLKAHTQVCGLK